MELSGRSQSLAERHAELEREIAAELKRPLPDNVRLAGLKKEKLRLKDEMHRVDGGTRSPPAGAMH
jgi:hypothetical protein